MSMPYLHSWITASNQTALRDMFIETGLITFYPGDGENSPSDIVADRYNIVMVTEFSGENPRVYSRWPEMDEHGQPIDPSDDGEFTDYPGAHAIVSHYDSITVEWPEGITVNDYALSPWRIAGAEGDIA